MWAKPGGKAYAFPHSLEAVFVLSEINVQQNVIVYYIKGLLHDHEPLLRLQKGVRGRRGGPLPDDSHRAKPVNRLVWVVIWYTVRLWGYSNLKVTFCHVMKKKFSAWWAWLRLSCKNRVAVFSFVAPVFSKHVSFIPVCPRRALFLESLTFSTKNEIALYLIKARRGAVVVSLTSLPLGPPWHALFLLVHRCLTCPSPSTRA